MKKVILETLLGLILSVGGFGLIFFGLTGVLQGILAIVGMIGGVLVVVAGVFLLYKAGTKDVQKPNFTTAPVPATGERKSILEKNQELVDDYNKTMRARDKLKILKMSAAADEK